MGTTADKLAKLAETKAALKSAINGSGNTVEDVFSDYPAAIIDGKSDIAAAITEKGVSTSATDSFAVMAENVGKIATFGYATLDNTNPSMLSFMLVIDSNGQTTQVTSKKKYTILVPSIAYAEDAGELNLFGDAEMVYGAGTDLGMALKVFHIRGDVTVG